MRSYSASELLIGIEQLLSLDIDENINSQAKKVLQKVYEDLSLLRQGKLFLIVIYEILKTKALII